MNTADIVLIHQSVGTNLYAINSIHNRISLFLSSGINLAEVSCRGKGGLQVVKYTIKGRRGSEWGLEGGREGLL